MAPNRRTLLKRLGSLAIMSPIAGCSGTQSNRTEPTTTEPSAARDGQTGTGTRTKTSEETPETTRKVEGPPDYTGCTDRSATVTADVHPSDPLDSNAALVIESCLPVAGTNVNVGVQGVAKNITGQWLVDCVIDVRGEVGGQTFSAQVTRSPLSPQDTWEWEVPFGTKADGLQDDSPEQIAIRTRAEYMKWD